MKYKDKVFEGATFPDAPIKRVKITFSQEMVTKYIPTINSITGVTKGTKLLAIIMASKEGYYKGTRSYRYNNPANIGNTDSGANKGFKDLESGIKAQISYIMNVANGYHKSYPIGKQVFLKPYYSEEIARNQKTYGIEPYVAGYRFVYDGSLEQFVKIYSTGARSGNGYLSMIISYFANHGIIINEKTTLKEIISLT
jgi:hypothetical protein